MVNTHRVDGDHGDLAHRKGQSRDGHSLGQGWRYEMVGRDLEEFLDGNLALAVEKGRGHLKLIPTPDGD